MARKVVAERALHCDVIAQAVVARLVLKPRPFVLCSESDCMYVEANRPPCPLTPGLFADGPRVPGDGKRDPR